MPSLTIRKATVHDCKLILQFITELAIYEKAEEEVVATEQHFKDTLFCENPRAKTLICESDGSPIGFALYFFNYSTWLGKYGVHLEDLYISPSARGLGGGKRLLQELAKIAIAEDCGRIEWNVLDWNEPAIQFYHSIGARQKDGWIGYRLEGDTITTLADS